MFMFSQFQNGINKMILFFHIIDEFHTTNEWSITLAIIVLKYCTMQYSNSMQYNDSNGT